MKETKSNWNCVTKLINEQDQIFCGPRISELLQKSPQEILNRMINYKIAAKILGKDKRILDVNCQEGFGTYVLANECGSAVGVDQPEYISIAKTNFPFKNVQFLSEMPLADYIWDGVVALDLSVQSFNDLVSFLTRHKNHRASSFIAIMGIQKKRFFFPSIIEKLENSFRFLFYFVNNQTSLQAVKKEEIANPCNLLIIGCAWV